MNSETKKNLASNWFKTLQDTFCDDISKIEKNKNNLNIKENTKFLKSNMCESTIDFYNEIIS